MQVALLEVLELSLEGGGLLLEGVADLPVDGLPGVHDRTGELLLQGSDARVTRPHLRRQLVHLAVESLQQPGLEANRVVADVLSRACLCPARGRP